MLSFLGFSKRDILQTYSTHHFWSKQTDSRWWWPILYKRPSSDFLGRMWKLHMYWRLNIIYNIVIINIYFLIFSISSVSLTSNWAAVGMSLLARFSASALTLSRWSDGLRRKEKWDEFSNLANENIWRLRCGLGCAKLTQWSFRDTLLDYIWGAKQNGHALSKF